MMSESLHSIDAESEMKATRLVQKLFLTFLILRDYIILIADVCMVGKGGKEPGNRSIL